MLNNPYYLGDRHYALRPEDWGPGDLQPFFLAEAWWRERRVDDFPQDVFIPAGVQNPDALVNPVPPVEETPRQRQRRLEREHLARHRQEVEQAQQREREALAELPEIEAVEGIKMVPKVKLTPFKLPISTVEDLRLRFAGCVITYKDCGYFVVDAYLGRGGELGLVLEDGAGVRGRIPYSKIDDVRSPAPGYLTLGPDIGYFIRLPVRNQSQGLTGQNTRIRSLGNIRGGNLRFHHKTMIEGLNNRRVFRWSPDLARAMREGGVSQLRLCNEIAVYSDKSDGKIEIKAEYLGRELGVINEDRITAHDPDDLLTSWIGNECNEVGLQLAA